MKRWLTGGAIIVFVLAVAGFTGLNIWIGQSVKQHISVAKSRYPGSAEEALIAFLLDETNSPVERTHIAIWTLGQIRSEKALPYLHELYRDDPQGLSCKGRHDEVLCQYELYKAICAIEKNRPFSHARFNR